MKGARSVVRGKGGLVAAAVVLGLAAGCAGAGNHDGGMGFIAGCAESTACQVSVEAALVAMDAGPGCGSFRFSTIPSYPNDPAAFAAGVDCALEAQDAGLPFQLATQFGGVDTSYLSVFVHTPDGHSFVFSQQWINCLPAPVFRSPCESFIPQEIPGSDYYADGGLLGIVCAGPDASVCLCQTYGC
jgi:hypothetical protein